MTRHPTARWNLAHLGLLVGLGAYAYATHRAQWAPFATLLGGLVLTLAWLAWHEWRNPHRADWTPTPRELRRDGLFFTANAVANSLGDALVRGLALAAAAWLHPPALAAALPWWAAVPLAVVVAEFFAYWLHRASHAGGWLWDVHAVHHRSESVNLANNATTHPINVLLLKTVRVLPLLLLGFAPEAIVYAGLFAQAQSFATHANTRGTMGWLNWIIGTAELHRRHHSVRVDEALNFGTALPLWDQVFGTYRWRGTAEPSAVGIGAAERYPSATDVWGLMRYPLWRARRSGPALAAAANGLAGKYGMANAKNGCEGHACDQFDAGVGLDVDRLA